ncbi:MAG TPA: hypothetical protein VFZ79_06340 [Acidimicrobiales bacterium]
MTVDRIAHYLHDRAAGIELPPADPARIARRAGRRRHVRRSVACVAAATVVAGGSVTLAQRGGDARSEVTLDRAAATESPLDWALVEPTAGPIGVRTAATAFTDDGAVYTLSTAPAAEGASVGEVGEPATLYRSDDGAAWAPVRLPGDLWASSLASSGGTLYAVGTSPSGGGATYQVAVSGDGGATWSTTDVPSELAELQARYPGEVRTAQPTVAVHDGTVVVSAPVLAALQMDARLPGGLPGWADSWQPTDEGAVVYRSGECDGASLEADSTVAVPCGGADTAQRSETFTWAELGVDSDLRDLVLAGRTYVFVSHDGGEFSRADLGDAPVRSTTGSRVVATDDGFTLLLSRPGSPERTAVLASSDGDAWRPDGELPGYLVDAGTVDGRAAVAVGTVPDPSTSVHLQQADGSWLAVDPRAALDDPHRADAVAVAFGPLGWAATMWVHDGGDGSTETEESRVEVVHSVDGTTLSPVPLDGLVERPALGEVGLTVTADAVVVRITEPGDGDPATVSSQQVVVGTPRG